MQSLTVVGRENDLLIVVNESGERFSITIDQALLDQVRRTPSLGRSSRHQVSPKDIQAHIRRGLTAQQVADLTGEDLAYVRRFEGPVLAEREFIVEQARQMALGDGAERSQSFGELVSEKLDDLSATNVSWSAWKEETGWRIEVVFFEGDVEHRAQWNFDQRKHTLTPQNDDATVLSQKDPIRGPLIPKLRAVPTAEASSNEQRFDSEIFEDMSLDQTGPLLEPVPYGRTGGGDDDEEDDDVPTANTADLLEVLRRRRGEREPAPDYDQDSSRNAHPSTGSIRLVTPDDESDTDASVHPLHLTEMDGADDEADEDTSEPKPSPKRNRPEMPSWDDIVFGTKSDDDPA